MPSIHRNLCRVCLGEGTKSIFPRTTSFSDAPTRLAPQYDRLVEKLRYVGMLPVTESPSLPCMLCYNCIVQLNMAYNFKNTIVETTMYLERLSIENGLETMTPAASCIDEEDQASVGSSMRDVAVQRDSPMTSSSGVQVEMPPPRPISTISSSTLDISPNRISVRDPPQLLLMKVRNNHQEQQQQQLQNSNLSTSSSTGTDDSMMLEADQIKKEPEDPILNAVAEAMIQRSMQSDRNEEASGSSTRKNHEKVAHNKSTTETSSKRVRSEQRTPKTGGTPTKRPMVAVPTEIARNSNSSQDKQFLAGILRKKAAIDQQMRIVLRNQRVKEEAAAKRDREEEMNELNDSIRRADLSLGYDLDNSKMIREMFLNLPKSRLRKKRTFSSATAT